MDEETQESKPWPRYKFELFDKKDLQGIKLLGSIELQAQTYEEAVKIMMGRVKVSCVIQE